MLEIAEDIDISSGFNLSQHRIQNDVTASATNSSTEKWQKIELDENQLETLNKFIESEIEQAIPKFHIDFECEILWEVECDEKCLEFNYWSSPIKLKLNDILSK